MFFHFYFLYTSIHCVCFNTRVVFQTFAVIVAYIIIARYSVCTLITVLNDTNINLKLNPCAHVALSLLSLNIYMYSSLVRSWGLVQYWTVVTRTQKRERQFSFISGFILWMCPLPLYLRTELRHSECLFLAVFSSPSCVPRTYSCLEIFVYRLCSVRCKAHTKVAAVAQLVLMC